MNDAYDRKINYLRISVTDLCNMRCIYCMPEGGVEKLPHESILSVEEIEGICRAAAGLGVTKIRITGGEPLVRRGVGEIARGVCAIPGLSEVCLTTNGVLLGRPYEAPGQGGGSGAKISARRPYTYARMLADAGVSRVNISLDSLDPNVYNTVTRRDYLTEALAGVDAAFEAGLTPVKINAVLMGGVNDGSVAALAGLTRREGVQVRFIEIMPIGECAAWNKARFISGAEALAAVPGLEPCGVDGVAEIYRRAGYPGTIGVIPPVSSRFCATCNRIRVTADGRLKPCLHSGEEIPLKGLRGDALTEAIRRGIEGKPAGHALEADGVSASARGMNRIGG
ncbi:MAG: GTP 3',8-cyclase MoaA [Clostridiales Family XIII bacterium]|jgi:cyclic pyranopterin phosphate synthase|nr:GTP 3',8-cyclase MoaA [Clostridiales Family XIII bacterium]